MAGDTGSAVVAETAADARSRELEEQMTDDPG
jgi:hypothetical protein